MNRFAQLCVAFLFASVAVGCVTNPATGKKNLNFYGDQKEEIALGVQAQPSFIKEYGGEVPSPEIRSYVSNLGQQLAAKSERPDLPWEFHVLDSAVINAFALPGGKVFMSRGLMEKMTNEAQLAGVLGHEIGHVTAMHIGQRMTQATSVQILATGIGVAGGATNNEYLKVLGVGAQAGGTVYLLKFSRDQESQSDELGVRYMSKLGYNPVGQVQVMEILKAAAGGGSGGMEILQTHPLAQTRIDRLNALIKKEYPDYNANPPKYFFKADEFKQNILIPLSKLPPPKHTGAEAAKGASLKGHSH